MYVLVIQAGAGEQLPSTETCSCRGASDDIRVWIRGRAGNPEKKSFLLLVTFQFEEAHDTVRLLMSGRQRASFWFQLLMITDQCGRSAIVDIDIG